MSKYHDVVSLPLASSNRLAGAHAVHARRAFLLALEAEMLDLADALVKSGRAVELTASDAGVTLRLREHGPTLAFFMNARGIVRNWEKAGSVVARTDELAVLPVPTDPARYAEEAASIVGALVPTINTLLG